MMGRARNRRGSSALEFVLVGIPVIFVTISTFELARGMWMYESLAYAVREGSRYAAVHGRGCAPPATCQVTIGNIAGVIRSAGTGLDPNSVAVTFVAANGASSSGSLAAQMSNTAIWPPTGANAQGQDIRISAKYTYRTFLAVFWPGAGAAVRSSGVFYLPATSNAQIQF
jgi:hypothetical protein